MLASSEIVDILKRYNHRKITIATVCSHSALPMFYATKQEGFRTLGIAVGEVPHYHSAFRYAMADNYLKVDNYNDLIDLPEVRDYLIDRNVVIIPNGSFVEYLKRPGENITRFGDLPVPTFGNKKVLAWEADRKKQREWLTGAGIRMPKRLDDPSQIEPEHPVIVKDSGAKGGMGFFIATNEEEYRKGVVKYGLENPSIQEYIFGVRYYPQFFYTPLKREGRFARHDRLPYNLSKGSLELLGGDRRDEADVDEFYRAMSAEEMRKTGRVPKFVVTGNKEVVFRESLLPTVMDYGKRAVESSLKLFGGMVGPFGLEGVFDAKKKFWVFEVTARLMAGATAYANSGSVYSSWAWRPPRPNVRKVGEAAYHVFRWGHSYWPPGEVSAYRRIGMEINHARKPLKKDNRIDRLVEIIS